MKQNGSYKTVVKYHGAGNDFIILNEVKDLHNIENFIKNVCHRRFGIGADGFIFPTHSSNADICMNFYNSDGSIAEMCGNGLRCFAKFVYDNKLVPKNKFIVETLAGDLQVEILEGTQETTISKVRINMGKGSFVSEEKINLSGREFLLQCGFVGVPHALLQVESLDKDEVLKYGPILEKHEKFPNNINVNFVELLDENNIKIDTWERGAGNTLACGTGASASVFILNKLKKLGKSVTVKAPGGDLFIELKNDDGIYMTGEACIILTGEYYEGRMTKDKYGI